MSRQISGLKWAQTCIRPRIIPIRRARGAKLKGLQYERQVAKHVLGCYPGVHGQWFEYEDLNGRGFCQTDLLFGCDGHAVVMEVKYTWTLEGHQQLEGLYLPIVRAALERPTVGLVICKRLVPELVRNGVNLCEDLPGAISSALGGRRVVMHWLGSLDLGPPRPVAGSRPHAFT